MSAILEIIYTIDSGGVHCSSLQCSAVQCSAVQCSAVYSYLTCSSPSPVKLQLGSTDINSLLSWWRPSACSSAQSNLQHVVCSQMKKGFISIKKKIFFTPHQFTRNTFKSIHSQTSQESQKAALRTSHRLLRCQVVLTKRCHYYYWYYYYCHFFYYYYCHNLIFWVLSQFDFF